MIYPTPTRPERELLYRDDNKDIYGLDSET